MIKDDSFCQLNLGGEYRTLTFLFSDIRGFTAMSETKTPEEVVSIVNFYLNLQSEIVKQYNGDIDKFIGDEVMVSFSGKDSVDRAIRCALAIQERISKENIVRQKNAETICQVGIGINRDEVIVGNIGSKNRMDFTSIGSGVNLAARLCSHSLAGQILIEQSTSKATVGYFNVKKEEAISVKGISKSVNVVSIDMLGV